MVYAIGKPRRLPIPGHPAAQISSIEAPTAQEPQALNCLGFIF